MVLGLLSGVAVVLAAQQPILDVDVYWHLLAGGQLATGSGVAQIGSGWSFAPSPGQWTTTQWAVELLFHHIFERWSWAALVAFRTITAAVAIAILAATTLRHRPAALAGFPFLLGVCGVFMASQDRPQQITYIGSAVLGGVLANALRDHQLPRWWTALLGTALWANCHGGWVLAPFVFGLITLNFALEPSVGRAYTRHALALTTLSALVGLCSPAGVANLTAVSRLSNASDLILEWQPTSPINDVGILIGVMLLMLAVAWARSVPVPPGELIAMLAICGFALIAVRNVVPALLLMAPVVAERLAAAFPAVGRAPEPRWSAPAGVALAGILTLAAVAALPGREHLPVERYPVSLARAVSALPPGQRVLNHYNTAGLILWFGGARTRVGIDGRTDRYGAEYIRDYLHLLAARGDWQELLTRLNPTSALIQEDSALAHILTEERGWQVFKRDSGFVLLIAPRIE